MCNSKFMESALQAAREGMEEGQSPFGSCIVKNGEAISIAHNEVWEQPDITAHAEVQAIRKACNKLNTIDLSGCIIYATCEPCPMCLSAIHWARIDKVYYGAKIDDAREAGFNELTISNEMMKKLGGSALEIESGLCEEEACRLFHEWLERPDKRIY